MFVMHPGLANMTDNVIVGGPPPLPAREGRENQRYSDNGERLVAGCIPVRCDPARPGPAGVRVLLVNSRGGKGLVFPKGGWETDEDMHAAAKRETVEEAGVRGKLEEPMVGIFPFYSGKASRLQQANQGRCIAYMFVMHVAEELPTWPEGDKRTRRWCTLDEAVHIVRHEWMQNALSVWIERQGWQGIVQPSRGNCLRTSSSEPPALSKRIAAQT